MVEEAVSYNELDYVSVSAAWGGLSSPLCSQGCEERHGGVFLGGSLSHLANKSLQLGDLKVLSLPMAPLWAPSLLLSSCGQQSDC